MKVIEVSENNFNDIILNEERVLIDFNATWCGPCRMLKPILEEYSNNTSIKVCSCNVDDNPKLAAKYNIYSIPCLIILEKGKEIKRNVGFVNLEELKEFVNE